MSSSYKPKLLQIFMHQKQDSLPELVQIRNIPPEKDEDYLAQYTNKKFKKQLQNPDDYRLDLSAYKHESVTKTKTNHAMSSIDELEMTKTHKRLAKQITDLETRVKDERRKVLIYEEKIETLEVIVDKSSLKLKEFDNRIQELERENETLTVCKEGLEKQIRELRLIESSQFNSYNTKVQPNQYKKEIFDKLETYMKRLIQSFIEGLKPERINKSVEDKIEEFLSQLLQINAQSIELTNKNKYSSKDKQKLKEREKASHKYSYTESPIADESSSYTESNKHKFSYSPFKQSRYEGQSDYYIEQSQFKKGERQKQKDKDVMERYSKNFSRVSREENLPRFNFIKQSVDPSINDQSAFVSINQISKSVEKSYERNDRSRSQRRKKIFQ